MGTLYFSSLKLTRLRARLRGHDFATGTNFSFNQYREKSFAFFLGKVIL